MLIQLLVLILLVGSQSPEFCNYQATWIANLEPGGTLVFYYFADGSGTVTTFDDAGATALGILSSINPSDPACPPDSEECAVITGIPVDYVDYLGLQLDVGGSDWLTVYRYPSDALETYSYGRSERVGTTPECRYPTSNPTLSPSSTIPSATPTTLGTFVIVQLDFPIYDSLSDSDKGFIEGLLAFHYNMPSELYVTEESFYGVFLTLIISISSSSIVSASVYQLEDTVSELTGVHIKYISYSYDSTTTPSSTPTSFPFSYSITFELLAETYDSAASTGSTISSSQFETDLLASWTNSYSVLSDINGDSQVHYLGEYYLDMNYHNTTFTDWDGGESRSRQQITEYLQGEYGFLSDPYPIQVYEVQHITSQPSHFPSFTPTRYPSVRPSTTPTSSLPTGSPVTSRPTLEPTTSIPTRNPLTTTPSSTPSTPPATDPPTRTPSKKPTTLEPTRFPVPQPSIAPTTLEPTFKPFDGNTRAPSASPTFAPSRESVVCEDTPGWDNGYGMGCDQYEDFRWCENGIPLEWVGDTFNNPEQNCCICGREALLLEEIRILEERLEAVESEVQECYASQYNEERVYSTDLLLQKAKIREIEEYIEDECFASEFGELSDEVQRRLDALQLYVKQATKNLIKARNLPTESDDVVQRTFFEYLVDTSQQCDLTGITYDTVNLSNSNDEDELKTCLLFCAYASNCQAVNFATNGTCALLHSVPISSTHHEDYSCFVKREESATSTPTPTFSPGEDNLCLCYPNALDRR